MSEQRKVPMVRWLVPTYDRDPATGRPMVLGDSWQEFSGQCANCRRLRYNLGCGAFRGPIPEAILTGEHDHREPFPGDRGLRYAPLARGEAPRLGWSDEDRDD